MHVPGPHGAARFALLIASIIVFAVAAVRGAEARTIAVDAGDAPIVRIALKAGNVLVKTWDRPSVQVESEADLTVRRAPPVPGSEQVALPIFAVGVDGQPSALPAETFVFSLPPGMRDRIVISGEQAAVTVTIPSTASLVFVGLHRGRAMLRDYKGGTFFARIGRGAVALVNVDGSGFAQVAHGPVVAVDSTFNRLRARTGTGDLVFERCRAKQIDVTSLDGSILYDNGVFEPGLARLESANGNVAVGVMSGGVQIGARSTNGRIYSAVGRRGGEGTPQRASETLVSINGGGPLVTATTGDGDVFVYEGSLVGKNPLPAEWQALRASLQRHADPFHGPLRAERR